MERDVQTVRQQFGKMIVLHPTLDIQIANQLIKAWLFIDQYWQRNHATTHFEPYPIFVDKEQPALLPLPQEPFEITQWKEAKIHPDHYIQLNRRSALADKKAYSVPHAYMGKKVWVKGTPELYRFTIKTR